MIVPVRRKPVVPVPPIARPLLPAGSPICQVGNLLWLHHDYSFTKPYYCRRCGRAEPI